MSLFDERVNLKPYEYPHLLKFKTAIQQSYWVHDEFNFEVGVGRVDTTPRRPPRPIPILTVRLAVPT